MKTTDIMRRAARNLRQAKGRTILTSLAIAVGSFTLTMSFAAGEGARDYADKLISSNASGQVVMVMKDKAAMSDDGFSGGGLKEYSEDISTSGGFAMKMITQDDVDRISKMDGVEKVTPFYSLSTKYFQISGSNKKYVAQVAGFDPGRTYKVVAGSLPEKGKDLSPKEATIPESFASSLGMSADSLIGKTVTITAVQAPKTDQNEIKNMIASGDFEALEKATQAQIFTREVKVGAVIGKGMSMGSGAATSGLTIDNSMAREIAELSTKGTDNYQKYYAAMATVKPGYQPESLKSELEAKNYGAQTAKDLQSILFTIVNILQGIVIFFGILALLASVFGIINTQYISVLERTSQIGLMKALGMSRRDVGKLFRYEAAWIGFLGGVLGAGLAWLLGTVLNPWISKQLELGEGNYLLVFIWWHMAILVVGLTLVAIIAGWFPARKAARLDPIEALRTE